MLRLYHRNFWRVSFKIYLLVIIDFAESTVTHLVTSVKQLYTNFSPEKPQIFHPGFYYKGLTMTYFHCEVHTIIGAKSFHCPVRMGRMGNLLWFVRHNCWRDQVRVQG